MNVNKIFIAAPANYSTGGPELLHQLAAELIANGYKAFMYYFYSFDKNNPVHPELKCYNVPYVFQIEDEKNNILIVPEILTHYLFQFSKIAKMIWWLSVDYYFESIQQAKKSYKKKHKILSFFREKKVFEFQKKYRNKFTHLIQSRYAFDFFKDKKEKRVFYLTDYLNDFYLSLSPDEYKKHKKNKISYNPRKGLDFTNKLIRANPDLNWIPIENKIRTEVAGLLKESKIYIDFGHHPGKDRLPREAAMCACVVVTSRDGAAKNDVDIPIIEELKIEKTDFNIPKISMVLRKILDNYDIYYDILRDYRLIIADEKRRFQEEVVSLFKVI